MYYGNSAILSESYLDNIFNHTQMILDSENFISNLYEADGNKENFLIRIFKIIKEKIIVVINAIKKIYNLIVEKIKGTKKDSSKLDDVKIVGAVKDKETAEEVINNFKDNVDKAQEEVKSAWKDMEDTKANVANNIKQNHDFLNQYIKDITESIKKNTESFEDSQSNIDEMLKDIDDSLNDLLDDEDKSSNKNLPAVVREKNKYAILINKEDIIELVKYNEFCGNLSSICDPNFLGNNIYESSQKPIERLNVYYELKKRDRGNMFAIYNNYNRYFKKDIDDFDSFKNELEDIFKVENTKESINKPFHFEESVDSGFKHFNEYKGKVEIINEYNSYESYIEWINKNINLLKKAQDNFERNINSVEAGWKDKELLDNSLNKSEFLEILNNYYKAGCIETLKLINYLSNYFGRCIIASQQQNLRFENWLQQHLKFIYI